MGFLLIDIHTLSVPHGIVTSGGGRCTQIILALKTPLLSQWERIGVRAPDRTIVPGRPHPIPLPKGEGISWFPQSRLGRLLAMSRLAMPREIQGDHYAEVPSQPV
jgi:hypothetical protein